MVQMKSRFGFVGGKKGLPPPNEIFLEALFLSPGDDIWHPSNFTLCSPSFEILSKSGQYLSIFRQSKIKKVKILVKNAIFFTRVRFLADIGRFLIPPRIGFFWLWSVPSNSIFLKKMHTSACTSFFVKKVPFFEQISVQNLHQLAIFGRYWPISYSFYNCLLLSLKLTLQLDFWKKKQYTRF